MYISGQLIQENLKVEFPEFKEFSLKDRELIQPYIEKYDPMSCEYSFANLFAWQGAYRILWTFYQDRVLFYDFFSKCAFMPLGETFLPEELAILSLNLKNRGLSPDINLATQDYLEKYPEIKHYYTLKEERDHSEYIYDVGRLADLSGKKLHKKRNLVSQFNRLYPNFEVHPLQGDSLDRALKFSLYLKDRMKISSKSLDQEMDAIEVCLKNFDNLGLEGLEIKVDDKIVAFSVFSRLGSSCYDIHFEKADINFKGAAQAINQETAKYLQDRCLYLNREQDLGIKGLRQAKMSYEPSQLITPVRLIFAPSN